MIISPSPAFSLIGPFWVSVHKGCGGYVDHKPFLPEWYVCPKCEALLHKNNVVQEHYVHVAP